MPYCTLEQLTERYTEQLLLQLTDRATPPVGTIDSAAVDRAIANAEAEIDSYLAAKYQLPLADVPAVVTDLAQIIAIYKLHPYSPDPKIKDDYDQAMKRLGDISTGKAKLPIAGAEPAAVEGSGVLTNDRERPFSEDNLTGFI